MTVTVHSTSVSFMHGHRNANCGGVLCTVAIIRDDMPDAKLVKGWKITRTLLERARHALPGRHEPEYAVLLTRYHDFVEHNELELALDVLVELGQLTSARGGFWHDLERAAENMGLTDKLPAFRAAFAEAPVGPKLR